MKRFLGVLGFALILVACDREDQRPNMIVVLIDDMRWDEFGAAGHNYIETPNIDRLAREGVQFTNAFATTPLCSPSRACFLTGQYAHHNGIVDNTARDKQSHELMTFPRVLDQAGYETAFMGKWHMGNDDSPRPGFDHWVALKGQGEATDPNLNVDGNRMQAKGYVTDVLSDYALKFIRKKRKTPFLLYLSEKALHPNIFQANDGSTQNIGGGGFIAAERHKGLYTGKAFKRRPNASIVPEDKPALMRSIPGVPPLSDSTATSESTIRDRAEMLMAIDESLGNMMSLLDSLGQLDNTIIVFTSDHGYWYGEHCLDDERRLAYEEGIRIPFLVRYSKAIPAGLQREAMVQSIDVAPTLLTYAGAQVGPYIDGKPLQPLIQDPAAPWRSEVFIEYFSDTVFPRIYKMGYDAVRDNRYKYIRYKELEGMDEFYDLEKDQYELTNAIHNEAYQSMVNAFNQKLDQFVK